MPPRDSAELITAAYTLSIPHPPGYPLYTMLGKLFTLIPFGSIAWRVNFMSLFFASLTVYVAYLIILKLSANRTASLIGAAMLAFTPFFWKLAVVAEVFSLHAFLAALMVLILLRWEELRDLRLLYLFSFVFGLGLANHHTTILFLPAFIYFIWVSVGKELKNIKRISLVILFFILGLIPYLYLPLRSMQNPYIDWGDPQTFGRFIDVLTRAQYGSMKLDPTLGQAPYSVEMLWVQTKIFAWWMIEQFTLFGFALGIFGAGIFLRDNFKKGMFLLLLFLVTGLGFVLYVNYPFNINIFYPYCKAILGRFMLPPLLVFALWIGIGAGALIKYHKAAALGLALLVLASLTLHYKEADRSRYYYVDDLINNILITAQPDSIIFTGADSIIFGLWHAQGVEGRRKDLKIISAKQFPWRIEQVVRRWPGIVTREADAYNSAGEFIADVIKNNIGKTHIYADVNHPLKYQPYENNLVPSGMIFEIIPDPSLKAKRAHLEANMGLWGKYRYRSGLYKAERSDYFTYEILDFYAEARNFSGVIFAMSGEMDRARKEFKEALKLNSAFTPAEINLKKISAREH